MNLIKVISCLLLIACIIWLPASAVAQDEPVEDPAMEATETANDTEDGRYTTEQFDALSDDEKRDIYFNSPELLPDNFEPAQYLDVLHQD
jgi:hypothetical protein